MMPIWLQIFVVIASPIFAAGGAYGAVRTRMDYIEQKADRANDRLDDYDERFITEALRQ